MMTQLKILPPAAKFLKKLKDKRLKMCIRYRFGVFVNLSMNLPETSTLPWAGKKAGNSAFFVLHPFSPPTEG